MMLGIPALMLLNLLVPHSVFAWDSGDLELFDLVEEVHRNFYDVLGVEQTAGTPEIRKAYRRTSLQLHPDKNKHEEAEQQFRQVVAIYEVLKDEEKRKKYDEVLEHGLPDWRHSVYYYRRVRKMGLLEFLLLLFLILTVGHYLVSWSIYLEQKFLQQEMFLKRKKDRRKKSSKSSAGKDDAEPGLPEDVQGLLVRPKLVDLLPFLLVRTVLALPSTLQHIVQGIRDTFNNWQEEKRLKQAEEAEERALLEKPRLPKPRRVRTMVVPSETNGVELFVNQSYEQPSTGNALDDIESQLDEWLQENPKGKSVKAEWSEEDFSHLARLMAKFPGGAPGRWEKIALEMGRPITEVTSKAKQVKEAVSASAASRLVKFKELKTMGVIGPVVEGHSAVPDHIMTQRDDGSTDTFVNKVVLQDKTTERAQKTECGFEPEQGTDNWAQHSHVDGQEKSARQRGRRQRDFDGQHEDYDIVEAGVIGRRKEGQRSDAEEQKEQEQVQGTGKSHSAANDDAWTQNQQKLLELALAQFPRGTLERWDRISKCVSGKSKEDCIQRYKVLVELVKRKQQQQQ
uniref:dnaJ homolog subfamily C member 1 n=1 Tax=Myxine glutinosa TaxID=7769 RepID=UPI00358F232E